MKTCPEIIHVLSGAMFFLGTGVILAETSAEPLSDYQSAKSGGSFFLVLTLIFGGISVWKHTQWKKRANLSPQAI